MNLLLNTQSNYQLLNSQTSYSSIESQNTLFRTFCPNLKDVLNINFEERSTEIYRADHGHQREQLSEEESVLFKIIDPKGKLKLLLTENKIIRFRGNASVEEAQLILLDDTEHRDKEQQLIRGDIVNGLQKKSIVLLGESYDSNKTDFSPKEIDHVFAPNLDESIINSSIKSGWDDLEIYNDNYEKKFEVIAIRKKIKEIKSQNPQLNSLDVMIAAGGLDTLARLSKLEKDLVEGAEARTKTEWATIQKFINQDSDSTIIVLAGADHNNSPWLLEQLRESNLKYCIITPKQFYDSSKADIDDEAKYYQFNDNLSLLGSKC
jgi:hypothetical protein